VDLTHFMAIIMEPKTTTTIISPRARVSLEMNEKLIVKNQILNLSLKKVTGLDFIYQNSTTTKAITDQNATHSMVN
jgi:hypothetical protein